MTIRPAEARDIPGVLALLAQVLSLHADLRPDVFIPGTTKYSAEELLALFRDETRRSYVAVDEADRVLGYALCILCPPSQASNTVPFSSLYIDDLCVDRTLRGQHIGSALFSFVKEEARALGCYQVTLNVWEGNDGARAFYEKMGMKPQKTQMELVLEES